MPVLGTPERMTLWANGGGVMMQSQAAGRGGGRDFGGWLPGASGHLIITLVSTWECPISG